MEQASESLTKRNSVAETFLLIFLVDFYSMFVDF